MNKIRKGDEVIVTTGRDKGRRGTVLNVLDNGKLLVEGINVSKKHQRANPNKAVQGGIIDKEMPIELSNVLLFNPKTKKGDRVGIRVSEKGKDGKIRRVRIFKSSGETVDI